MKHPLLILVLCGFCTLSLAQTPKKKLSHDDYDGWKSISASAISANGAWVSFEENPQQGDGHLFIKGSDNSPAAAIPRGYKALFSPQADFAVFMIKAPYDSTRKAKLAGKKGDKLPADSLGIWIAQSGTLQKFAEVSSFQLPKDAGSWVAINIKSPPAMEDSTQQEKKQRKKGKHHQDKTTSLLLIHPPSGATDTVHSVNAYTMADNGKWVGIITTADDSVTTSEVWLFDTEKTRLKQIYRQSGEAKTISLDKTSSQAAFIASQDTGEAKMFDLFHFREGTSTAQPIVTVATSGLPGGWSISEHTRLTFSEDGGRLFTSTAPRITATPKDTLIDDEKVSVDIWNWKDSRLQPQQLVELSRDKKKNYLGVYHVREGKFVQLANQEMDEVNTQLKGMGNFALGTAEGPYNKLRSWDWPGYRDIYTVDVSTGKATKVLEKHAFTAQLSPGGKYVVWYNSQDSTWNATRTSDQATVNLTKGLEPEFYDEEHDSPSNPFPYGLSGWMEDDAYVLINDRYDIWKFDPSGKEKPVNFTRNMGRENHIRFRYNKLDTDNPYVESGPLLLTGFHEKTKKEGYYRLLSGKKKAPQELILADANFGRPIKAKNADRLIWTKESFAIAPDLWSSDMDFTSPQRLSGLQEQQHAYRWGTVELVDWTAYDGQQLKGLLYKPEGFDPNKKYPMLVYFYEKYTDRMHTYYEPQPIRASVYPSFYVSRGYLFFIPDIPYTTGQPGEDAYNSVVSGTEALVKNTWVDKDRIGIQGHSWGGYQTAYIITKTNMYRAAEAGAPVANMTSAYGGIRWQSGYSRMFQYEKTQSRLGVTLWEDTDVYLKNSPLFEVPKIETPVLMMHNDNDGAVPWYQGIEFFVALRRLDKPAWLVNYNGAGHGLSRRADKRDWAIRMQQFFDHYLMDAPTPVWMEYGVPATQKGKTMGFEDASNAER